MLVQIVLKYHDRNDRRLRDQMVWVSSPDLPNGPPDKKVWKGKTPYKIDVMFKPHLLPDAELYTAESAWCSEPGVLVADGIHRTTVGELKKRNIRA